MKRSLMLCLTVVLAGSLLGSGCGQKQEPPPPPKPAAVQPTAPAAPVPAAPAAVAPTVPAPPSNVLDLLASAKAGTEQAMALAKQGKYNEALALLQQKATEVQSNPEARQLVDSTIAKIKQLMAEAATKAATEKAGDALNKALGGLSK